MLRIDQLTRFDDMRSGIAKIQEDMTVESGQDDAGCRAHQQEKQREHMRRSVSYEILHTSHVRGKSLSIVSRSLN
jgi:hypothetical protein